jgi:sugar phosphate isomerase/epimerase
MLMTEAQGFLASLQCVLKFAVLDFHTHWATFCDALRASGYDGPVCVEVEDREFEDTLEARKESLRLSHQHLAPLLKQV